MIYIVPGSRWIERAPANLAPEARGDFRRVVEVSSADLFEDGFVAGYGVWQRLSGGKWVDDTGPGARRKTRIRVAQFVRRFDPPGDADG